MNRLKTQRREVVRGLNNDREGATWQYQRGPRYGDNRKGVAKDKSIFAGKTDSPANTKPKLRFKKPAKARFAPQKYFPN